ncbi:hypothetical protein [Dipodfec virus UOA04_Rod_653]|nr:hypothetical protein [Dipodfec virus UOA04_Rod_653]
MSYSFFIPPPVRYTSTGPLRFSVGFYRGRSRHILGWFSSKSDALDYLERCRETNSFYRYDYLESLF